MDGELKPADSLPLVQRIVDLYQAAEIELLQQIARRLNKGITTPGWQDRQLVELQRFSLAAEQLLTKLQAASGKAVGEQIAAAGNRGAAVAVGEATGAGVASTAVDAFAVAATAAELEQTLGQARGRIYRSANDIYRSVIAETVPLVTAGTITRQEAAQRSLTKLASNGVTGFVDRQGKRWEAASYVEMASRASSMNAAIEGHSARLKASGHNLIIVSDVPQECVKCRPWEGKILAIDPDGKHFTLDEARRAGLYHPNCRHSHARYQPGVTRSFGETADPQGDKDRQKLRYLERQVRAARREEAAALTPAAAKKARAKAAAYQAKIREHVELTSAKRQPQRERIGTSEKQRIKATAQWLDAEQKHIKATTIGGLKKLDRPDAPSRAAAQTNPKFGSGLEYGVNCQRCVQAYELRRRGIDVQAQPKRPQDSGISFGEFGNFWKRPDGTPGKFKVHSVAANANAHDEIVAYLANQPSTRGWIGGPWKTGNAHIFVYEVDKNGRVSFLDPQTGDVDCSRYINTIDRQYILTMRTDNLTPSDSVRDFVFDDEKDRNT